MRWFRLKQGIIARLACLALACQVFIAFDHLHLSKFSGGSIALSLSDGAGNGSASDSFSPAQKKPNGPADFCAICASINLASTLIVPVLALIIAPTSFVEVLRWSLAASEPAPFDHLPFHARGPPHA
jgi:hypothetical protein